MSLEGNRRAQRTGKHFEDFLDTQHELAKKLGLLAHAEHTQARSKVFGGKLCYEKAGVADYVLCLSDGRYMAVEAKSTEGKTLMLSRIEPLQSRHLNAVTTASNTQALLLVEFSLEGRYERFAMQWDAVPWAIKRSAESLSWDDACKYYSSGFIHEGECYLSKFVCPLKGEDGQPVDFRDKKVIVRG